jgi:hypothetical protein
VADTENPASLFARREAIKARREALYAEFVDEAARLYGDALGHQKDDAADLVKLFALLGRIRLRSPRPVITAAERTFDTIAETYLGPNRTMHEVLNDVHRGGFNFLIEFGEACRQDLALTEHQKHQEYRQVDVLRLVYAREQQTA